MSRSAKKRLIAALAVVLGVGIFGLVGVRAVFFPPTEPEAPAPPASRGLTMPAQKEELPEQLRIPILGIDALVQHVGLTKSGKMAVPTNFTDVGWYRYGTAPGFVGSAVIDGHVDNGLRLPGVFKKLNGLAVGDEIFVRTAAGAELRFVVQEVAVYGYKEVPTEVLFNRADTARLNLVTCDGAWVAGEKTYDKRLVVYAVLAP